MKNNNPCLSPDLEAIITILVASGLLLCIASNNMAMAFPLLVGMVLLKKHAIRCYERKLDKFYFYSYLLSSILLFLLLLLK